MSSDYGLKPCPFCGCDDVLDHSSCFFVTVKCKLCGATIKDGTVPVLVKKDKIPIGITDDMLYEATGFCLRSENGDILEYPKHGYVGINIKKSLYRFGVSCRWNRRSNENKI